MNKTICLDLDGTLLRDDGTVSQRSVEFLNQLIVKGIRVVIVTGRHFSEITFLLKKIKFNENSYYICCDGLYIYDFEGKCIFTNSFLSLADIVYLTDCEELKNELFVTNEINYAIEENRLCRGIKNFLKSSIKYISLEKLGEIRNLNVEKVIGDYSELRDCKELSKRYTTRFYQNGKFEVLPLGVNKYNGILKLIEIVNDIDKNQILYFGDEINDIECFEALENTVAVGNAVSEIKRLAKHITSDNQSDGVITFLEKSKIT